MRATALSQNDSFNSSFGKRARDLNGQLTVYIIIPYKPQGKLSCYDTKDKPCAPPRRLACYAAIWAREAVLPASLFAATRCNFKENCGQVMRETAREESDQEQIS
jgi:hypothetical protein